MADKPLQLAFDIQRRGRDGRLLAYVYARSSFVNAELVKAGYAEVATYPPNVRHGEEFMSRQREARPAKRGLWADPNIAQYGSRMPAPDGLRVLRAERAADPDGVRSDLGAYGPQR